jgi:hypothetical protein
LTKLKQAIESARSDEVRYGVREFFLFIGIGGWLGFIVLDGATYLLLALTLAVGLPLVQANAVKNAVAVPVTIIAMLVFAFKGSRCHTAGKSTQRAHETARLVGRVRFGLGHRLRQRFRDRRTKLILGRFAASCVK